MHAPIRSLLLFAAVLATGCTASTVRHTLPDNTCVVARCKNEQQHGTTKFYAPAGHLLCTATYRDGVLNGPVHFFDAERHRVESALFTDGKRDGVTRWFYPSGACRATCTFRAGVKIGPVNTLYETGEPQETIPLHPETGKRHGQAIRYWKNGEKRAVRTYQQDVLQGISRYYSRTGVLEDEMMYDGGELVSWKKYGPQGNQFSGTCTVPYENGSLHAEYAFKHGVRDGRARFFAESGDLKAEATYDDDRLNGTLTFYDQNGNVRETSRYAAGKLYGQAVLYHANGTVAEERHYSRGRKDGICRTYHANGKLARLSCYRNGTEHGVQKAFNPDGSVSSMKLYRDGVLVKEKAY